VCPSSKYQTTIPKVRVWTKSGKNRASTVCVRVCMLYANNYIDVLVIGRQLKRQRGTDGQTDGQIQTER